MADVFTLFDDYAARFARGERPDARDYLTRAGEGADELAGLIDAFLVRAAPPDADEDARTLAAAWLEGQPPLLELRTRRGLKRDAVVDALIAALSLDRAKRDKVKRYYHQLEGGLLDPRGVDDSVWAALADNLRARVEDLRAWRPRSLETQPAFYRRDVPARMALDSAPASAEPAEEDEVDRLFTRGAP